MAVDPFALVTLDEAKTHLDIELSDTSQDSIVERFVNEASSAVEKYLDRQVITRSYTEVRDGRNQNRLILRQWPAQKPTEIKFSPTGDFTSATALGIDQYDVDEYQVEVVLYCGQFPKGTRNIQIVYSAGYSTVPRSIESATLFLIEYYFDLREKRRTGVISRGKNNESTRYNQEWPSFIKDLLDPYKRGPLDYAANSMVLNQ